jgi:hypothetical protein
VLRLVEILLFLAPFLAFAAWRFVLPRRGPSSLALGLGVAMLVILGFALVWLSQEDTLKPGATYIPSHIENGVIVPGRGVSR